jgi:hypothetical protein
LNKHGKQCLTSPTASESAGRQIQKGFSAKAEHIIMLGQQLVTDSLQPFSNQREVSQKVEI